jgi:hypothetical protein
MISKHPLPEIALSVRQPWAWAIVHAGKDIENRSAAAVRHGMRPCLICIHASKGMTRHEYEDAAAFMQSIGVTCPRPDQLVRGAIIGTVRVLNVVGDSDSDWFFGPCGLLLADAKPCSPVCVPGALGYFSWQKMLLTRSEGAAIESPLPWMLSWPSEARAARQLSTVEMDPQRALL